MLFKMKEGISETVTFQQWPEGSRGIWAGQFKQRKPPYRDFEAGVCLICFWDNKGGLVTREQGDKVRDTAGATLIETFGSL